MLLELCLAKPFANLLMKSCYTIICQILFFSHSVSAIRGGACLNFFRAPFLWGGPFQTPPQNSAFAGSLVSTKSSELPERGGIGEENCPGRGRADREREREREKEKNKRKQDAQEMADAWAWATLCMCRLLLLYWQYGGVLGTPCSGNRLDCTLSPEELFCEARCERERRCSQMIQPRFCCEIAEELCRGTCAQYSQLQVEKLLGLLMITRGTRENL